jgi:hypothetical protein
MADIEAEAAAKARGRKSVEGPDDKKAVDLEIAKLRRDKLKADQDTANTFEAIKQGKEVPLERVRLLSQTLTTQAAQFTKNADEQSDNEPFQTALRAAAADNLRKAMELNKYLDSKERRNQPTAPPPPPQPGLLERAAGWVSNALTPSSPASVGGSESGGAQTAEDVALQSGAAPTNLGAKRPGPARSGKPVSLKGTAEAAPKVESLSRKDPRYQLARQRGLTDEQIQARFGIRLVD